MSKFSMRVQTLSGIACPYLSGKHAYILVSPNSLVQCKIDNTANLANIYTHLLILWPMPLI